MSIDVVTLPKKRNGEHGSKGRYEKDGVWK